MENRFKFKEGTEKANEILNRLREFIVSLPEKDDVPKEMWRSKLDDIISEKAEPLTIALVGEYDVGKSSIIKSLIGEDILINSNVATSEVKIYDYGDLKLLDMPGTLSGLEEHDQLAYEAAANSDLLLYVITNELFNSSNIVPFFDTLETLKKENQCMLVVNQMDRVNTMNRTLEEAIAILLEELTVRVKPYDVDQFSPVFISSRNYLDSLDEEDEEFRQELFESSRIDELKTALNKFCDENGLNGRLLRPLQSSIALLDSIKRNIGDEESDYDNLSHYYSKQKRLIIVTINSIHSRTNQLKISKKREILQLSRPVIKAFENKLEPDEINAIYEDVNNSIEEIYAYLPVEIENVLTQSIDELEDKLKEFRKSPLTLEAEATIDPASSDFENIELDKRPRKIPDPVKTSLRGGADDIGQYLTKNADDLAEQFVNVYKKARNVKFQPYGKIKLSAKTSKVISKSGKALGWAAVGWDFYCNAKEVADEAKWEKELRKIKAETKASFKQSADECEDNIDSAINHSIENGIQKEITKLDEDYEKVIEADKEEKNLRKDIKNIEDLFNETTLELNNAMH